MSEYSLLKVAPQRTETRSTPDQVRFQYLIAEIEKARQARAAWDATVLEFRKAEAERIHPLRATLRSVTRATVMAIDRLLNEKGWSRADRTQLQEMLCATAQMLLEADPSDAELKAIYDAHSATGFDDEKAEELEELKEHAAEFMGVDLDDDDIRSEEDLVERVYRHMAERESQQESRAKRRPKSKAQQRVEANAQAAKQFLRELYRKLASAVHPDREADAQRRAEKNELMQQINRAYATNDLLTLLGAQMHLERIDPEHVSKLSGERLKHYNKLLAEQLTAAKSELRQLEEAFRTDFGLGFGQKLSPQTLGAIIRGRAREIRSHISREKHFLELLANKAAIKRWLKERY
jgi:hypothetical protein